MKVIDATDTVMGRLASYVAKRLLEGEEIVIINAEKAIITGNKKDIMEKYFIRRRVGSQRKGPYYPRMPDRILRRCVKGMLPYKKPSGKSAYKRLKVFIGVPRKYENEDAIKIAVKMPIVKYIYLGDVSKLLGAHWEV